MTQLTTDKSISIPFVRPIQVCLSRAFKLKHSCSDLQTVFIALSLSSLNHIIILRANFCQTIGAYDTSSCSFSGSYIKLIGTNP